MWCQLMRGWLSVFNWMQENISQQLLIFVWYKSTHKKQKQFFFPLIFPGWFLKDHFTIFKPKLLLDPIYLFKGEGEEEGNYYWNHSLDYSLSIMSPYSTVSKYPANPWSSASSLMSKVKCLYLWLSVGGLAGWVKVNTDWGLSRTETFWRRTT